MMHPHRVAMTTSSSKFGIFDYAFQFTIALSEIVVCFTFPLERSAMNVPPAHFFSSFFQMTIKSSSLHDTDLNGHTDKLSPNVLYMIQ